MGCRMSFHAIHWAQQVKDPITSNEAFVLVTLAEYADDDGSHCFPAMSTVARKCRMSRSTVYRILRRLEEVHGLIVKQRSGKNGGTANSYRLLVSNPAKWPAERAENDALDPQISDPPNLLSTGEGVSPGDTGGVCHRDTPGVSPDATPRGVSPRDRGVSPGDTPGVSQLDTRITNNPPITTTAAQISGPGGEQIETVTLGDGRVIPIPAQPVPGATMLSDRQRQSALDGVRRIKAQLAPSGAGSKPKDER